MIISNKARKPFPIGHYDSKNASALLEPFRATLEIEMYFTIVSETKTFPDFNFGEAGNELACFVPNKLNWTQLNYGQGEGQIELFSCEWGFYYPNAYTLSVHLHTGTCELETAINFIKGVQNKVFTSNGTPSTIYIHNEE